MWTADQRIRLSIEHQILQREGFSHFSVYHDRDYDTYYASGIATSNSGRQYTLYSPIPSGFPTQRPPLYIIDPLPLRTTNGTPISQLGVSHAMHTLTPFEGKGWVQICHWREARWHSGIVLQKVFLKALIWIEAYEQHLATGRDLADFVRTMAEAA
jgi:hypothetical protein